MTTAAPLLLPQPRRLIQTDGWNSQAADPHVSIDPAAGLPFAGAEAYRLEIGAAGQPRIVARTDAGATHGRRTLAQLVRQYGERVPCMVIDDAPAFPTRGVMLDVSRDRVPTMRHVLGMVETLASLKFNHLQLYTEHTFAYSGHEDVWREWSPITPDEVRALDAHCRRHGIELAANQNCFGHLSSWLRHPRYGPMAETHGEWVFENAGRQFPRKGPFSLCPADPRSLALIEDLLGQLLPCFSSSLVNINCDETFDVGYGRSAEVVESRGRAAVYFEFVNKVAAITRRRGKRPMLWADIAVSQPESLGMFPEGAIALAWGYEPDTPFGDWSSTLRARGIETWVCPGTSSWRSITGRTTERRANLFRAAKEGVAADATGCLVAEWGDTGHHQQWPVSLLALAEAAQHVWNPEASFDARAAALHAFGEDGVDFGPWLEQLGDVDEPLRAVCGRISNGTPGRLRNSTAIFTDLHTAYDAPFGPPAPDFWRTVSENLEDLAAGRPPTSSHLVTAEIDHVIDVARLAVRRAILRRGGGGDRREVAEAAGAVREEHRRLWLLRSRPGGLEHSCSHYDRVIADLEAHG